MGTRAIFKRPSALQYNILKVCIELAEKIVTYFKYPKLGLPMEMSANATYN